MQNPHYDGMIESDYQYIQGAELAYGGGTYKATHHHHSAHQMEQMNDVDDVAIQDGFMQGR